MLVWSALCEYLSSLQIWISLLLQGNIIIVVREKTQNWGTKKLKLKSLKVFKTLECKLGRTEIFQSKENGRMADSEGFFI